MSDKSKTLDDVIESLGQYFGISSKSGFVSHLLNDGAPPDLTAKAVGAFMDLTQGGMLTCQLAKKLEDETAGAKTNLKDVWNITYEDADVGTSLVSDGAGPIVSKKSITGREKEGMGSMKVIVGHPPKGGGLSVNEKPSSPNKQNPALSCHMIFPSNLTVQQRDSGAAALFLNSIPTLELSRCQPYINITLISPTSPVSADNKLQSISISQFLGGQKNVETDSIERGLAEGIAIGAEVSDQMLEEAKRRGAEEGISTAGMELFTSPQTMVNGDEEYTAFQPFQSTATGGAPLSPGNAAGPASTGGPRAAPIIDKFRPFMSLSGLSLSVQPTTGLMAYKSAKMSLMLHDRSRLSEVAEFVKPDMYGNVELLIEYGWSHPDGSAASDNEFGMFLNSLRTVEKYGIVNSAFNFDDVGQVKIDLSLVMKGGVEWSTSKISAGDGVQEAADQVEGLMEAIRILLKRIGNDQPKVAEALNGRLQINASTSTTRAMMADPKVIRKIRNWTSKVNGKNKLSPDIKELAKELKRLYGPGDRSKNKDGAVGDLQGTIQGVITKKIKKLKKTPDPWFRGIPGKGKLHPGVDAAQYVSLAKLMMIFCGTPLAATGKWDEVQFIFYAFNDKASYCHDFNIAQFPINISDFETKFKDLASKGLSDNLPIGKFLGFVLGNFVSHPRAHAWGLTNMYVKETKKIRRNKPKTVKKKVGGKQVERKSYFYLKKTGNYILAKEYRGENGATLLHNERKRRLEEAYGNDAQLTFKMPRISMYTETVPVNDRGLEPKNPGQVAGGPEAQSILRVHVFDRQCSSNVALDSMLSAATGEDMGLLTNAANEINRTDDDKTPTANHKKIFTDLVAKAKEDPPNGYGLLEAVSSPGGATKYRIKGGFPALKNYVTRNMPSIKYGSQNSGILKANLTSVNNSALATIMMMRGGQGSADGPAGSKESGLPLQVSPTQLTLDVVGCPLLHFAQEIFVDFGTGTSADNIYYITGIEHSLAAGEYKTKVKLMTSSTWAKYHSLVDTVESAIARIDEAET